MQISRFSYTFKKNSSANMINIHRYKFINMKILKFADHVIWVQNPQKEVYLFMGPPVVLNR